MSRSLSLGSRGRLLLTAAALAATGCGSSYKMPTAAQQIKTFAEDKSYQRIAIWSGLNGVTDVLLVPGPQLYFAFRAAGADPGRVVQYSTTQPNPIATGRFVGVRNPAALAATATSVFVLDQGDTAAARAFRDPNWFELDCGAIQGVNRPIVDISQYWFVREYNFSGSDSLGAFTDTTFAWVNGVAADAEGAVYVSGVILHCFIDPFDARLRTLDNEYRIYRYKRGIDDRYVLGSAKPDYSLRRGVWGRDRSFEVVEGTGIGSSLDPRGMSWSNTIGAALYFADRGNNEAQKFDLSGSLANSFKLDICDEDTTLLVTPTDVAVDDSGSVYVVDAGNRRVLRYDPLGHHCIQRVDIESVQFGPPLEGPTAAASAEINGKNQVYVVDPAGNQVVVYRRR